MCWGTFPGKDVRCLLGVGMRMVLGTDLVQAGQWFPAVLSTVWETKPVTPSRESTHDSPFLDIPTVCG